MTTQYTVLKTISGQTLTVKLFTFAAPNTEVTGNTITVTERTIAKGEYVVSIVRAAVLPAGDYTVIAFSGSTPVVNAERTFVGVDGETATLKIATVELDSAVLALLQGSNVVQVPSPNVQGNLILTQGDSYDGIANPKAQWNVTTDYTDGWSVVLTIRDAEDEIVYSTSGTVASATSITVTIAAPTGLTMTGCPGQWQGKFDVELTKAGSKKTIALGVCYINEDQTRA